VINRQQQIKEKGFSVELANNNPHQPLDFSKIRVGIQSVTDAVLKLGDIKATRPDLADPKKVLDAINRQDLPTLREISNFFFRISGIYRRLCLYMAYIYRYDWYIIPHIANVTDGNSSQNKKVLKDFNEQLYFLDNSNLKDTFGSIALQIMKNGVFYGYKIYTNENVSIQELPIKYCRSRYIKNGAAVLEFNMKYFDDVFNDVEYRKRVLEIFGKEFIRGYRLFKAGKLKPDYVGDSNGWYKLDEEFTVKFNLYNCEYPPFISVIPAIIDLDEAQDLDKQKMAQQLLKLIIQKMPLDKNGELLFDIDEMRELHNNAIKMIGRAIGIDVLTTFADVEVEDMADSRTSTTTDELEKVERNVFNEAGVSQLQFNASGNIALQSSIANDEASMSSLIFQFERFINKVMTQHLKANPKKYYFKSHILPTTWYNYKELTKLYKEQTQLGYSKMLPALALGESQSDILASFYWENDILNLAESLVPPMSSNTMSNKNTSNSGAGRPEKDDTEKSTKTLQNEESIS